jgi:acylphosphatase
MWAAGTRATAGGKNRLQAAGLQTAGYGPQAAGAGGGNREFYTVGMLVARRFFVRGRVQGVGFRFHVLEAARLEGVQGWVRNLPDGSVEVFVEGDREGVTRMERKIRRGPPAARIEQVDTTDDVPTGRFDGFSVR